MHIERGGWGTNPTGTANYTKIGKQLVVEIPTMYSTIVGTVYSLTIKGMPASIVGAASFAPCVVFNSSQDISGYVSTLDNGAEWTIKKYDGSAFTGEAGIRNGFIYYMTNN